MQFNLIRLFSPAAILMVLAGCGNKKQQQQGLPPAVPVTVAEVKAAAAAYFDEYPGTVTAVKQTEIRAQVTGYVTGIFFKDGAKVSKGQRLYTIDQQLYGANLQQAIANLQVQETNMLKVQKDAERYHELDKNEAIAKQQVDYADAALEAAKKQVAAARANVNAVRSSVNFTTINAPFSGTIGISLVRTGTSVVAGQTIFNTISADNPIAVDFSIDQNELYRFLQLLQPEKSVTDSTFTIAFGLDVYPYPGKISLIDRAVDPQTGTIKIRLDFPNDKGLLKAGMSTTVRVLNNAVQKSILIPFKAVTEQLGEFYVYVVNDSSKVTQRKILLGKQIQADVIVKDGLKEGEKIVIQGVQNLREGAAISAQTAGKTDL